VGSARQSDRWAPPVGGRKRKQRVPVQNWLDGPRAPFLCWAETVPLALFSFLFRFLLFLFLFSYFFHSFCILHSNDLRPIAIVF
jgi:hypothetical protein